MTRPIIRPPDVREAVRTGSKDLFDKFSVSSVLSLSWEAGGVYPTLLGYAIGAIATLAIVGASHPVARFLPALGCLYLYVQVLNSLESGSFTILFVFASLIGIGCTFIQVLTWQQAFASIRQRRKEQRTKMHKVMKEE
ncbi:hypothetical protein Poli38472_006251 [Pythium oligandrum]|uniref:Uncharacterized protein n=1 Tax=Pythium oligandrum TaxID=41045 RepID=A0A8K1CV20_PYTOL|nr:hypothetical protein Poli38472_006251 [Pythium oligandrum]|eukprot:TMW68783.1 hypothetical protein Poli38472_006251 [Pythium oligandrum]